MTDATVSPKTVRSDLLVLRPDLTRPKSVLRLEYEPEPGRTFSPSDVVLRTESELAKAGSRYRRVLLSGLLLLLSPGLLAWLYWGILWWTGGRIQPFARGYYLPMVSAYELTTYLVVVSLVALVGLLAFETGEAMKRMSPDYRFFRDATAEHRLAVAEEVAKGSWPRTNALLNRGREFSDYRALIADRIAAVEGPTAEKTSS
jgi:hypothetical protein